MTKFAKKKERRSGFKCCDICGNYELLEQHHIKGRKIENANDAHNLCDICSNCHSSIHAVPPRIIVEGWFMTTNGRELLFKKI